MEDIIINNKKVDMGSLKIKDIDMKDYPNFSDAYAMGLPEIGRIFHKRYEQL